MRKLLFILFLLPLFAHSQRLEIWYPFKTAYTTTITDASGRNRTGTNTSTTYTALVGIRKGAAGLGTSTNRITTSAFTPTDSNAFTFSFWINWLRYGGQNQNVFLFGTFASNGRFALLVRTNNTDDLVLTVGRPSSTVVFTFSGVLTGYDNKWTKYDIVTSQTNKTCKLYRNGSWVSTATTIYVIRGLNTSAIQTIGSPTTNLQLRGNGWLDNFQFYSIALSEAKIKQNCIFEENQH